MDKTTRTLIQNATQKARRLLEQEFGLQLEGDYNILLDGIVLPDPGAHLDARERLRREKLVAVIAHHRAAGMSAQEARDALLREAAFTTLNRFVALKMLEARDMVQECVAKGDLSAGFREFGLPAPGLIALPDKGYRIYLESLFDEIGREVRVLFDRRDVAGQLWPRRLALNELLAVINDPGLSSVWGESETIGWVYQYFNGEDERREMRKSAAPQNSRELAVRNQFFTPSYVVAFLADNTLGRIWYEMRQGQTRLADQCRYLLRQPHEVFLPEGTLHSPPSTLAAGEGESQDKLIYVPYRKLKDPRQIQVLDPAVGSGHYLLYCFDLLLTIYAEAWDDCLDLLRDLRATYASKSDFIKQVPAMILRHNLHGVDIDPRAAQIADLALWMRTQRAYADMGIRGAERPLIRKTNIVVAEPMPGDQALLTEFLAGVDERLHDLAIRIWQKMQLAGEAGSLLKIEQEIDVALRAARTASLVDEPPLRSTTLALGQQSNQTIFTFASAEERQFWDQAERLLLSALRDYAQRAGSANGTRRWLFAENAAQGFAFIDVCRKRYDVVLMNPPFGAASKGWKTAFEKAYPRTKNDLYAAFVDRGLNLLHNDGLLGAITSRTGFFTTDLQLWREMLLHEARPVTLVDLGAGVLDGATVETAAYCLQKTGHGKTIFLRMLTTEAKELNLFNTIYQFRAGRQEPQVFEVNPSTFDYIPGRPFAYWISEKVRKLFVDIPALRERVQKIQHGLSTKEDYRFIRVSWEVTPDDIVFIDSSEKSNQIMQEKYEKETFVRPWVRFVKGGSASHFAAIIPLIVNWQMNGKIIEENLLAKYPYLNGKTNWVLHRECEYYRVGLTWPRRPHRRGYFAVVPQGALFSDNGPMLFAAKDDLWWICAFLNSSAYIGLLHLQMSRGSAINSNQTLVYEIGYIGSVPVPLPSKTVQKALSRLARGSFDEIAVSQQSDEISPFFWLPAILQNQGDSLTLRSAEWQKQVNAVNMQLAANQRDIDDIAFKLYNIEGEDRRAIKASLGESRTETQQLIPESDDGDEEEDTEDSVFGIQHSALVEDLISYALGAAFGRWDIRCATGERPRPEVSDPFAPLPVYSPGMLRLTNDERRTMNEADYPLMARDILVNDKGHQDDIITAIHEVLGIIWEKPDDIYREAAALLAGNVSDDLRPWLSANFFERHIKRYSKSRRRAPIYWCLSTPSRSYAIWLYYHRFNKDTLYRVLKEYVEPKIQLEDRRLAKLRGDAGPNPSAGQRDMIEKQEQFVTELQTFRENIARITPLWSPDMNDGVIINFAPLWQLTPSPRTWQKECQQTWEALVRGDYDWSALAMRLWPERVVPKCKHDRSLAIAHGLDDIFWLEGNNGKAAPRDVLDAEVRALMAERSSLAIQAALKALNAAPIEPEKPKKRAAEQASAGGKRRRKVPSDVVQVGMDLTEE